MVMNRSTDVEYNPLNFLLNMFIMSKCIYVNVYTHTNLQIDKMNSITSFENTD